MPIHELAEMTWEEVQDLDRARTAAILPVGAVEAHGPHLPLSTDVLIAEAMARSGAERLKDRDMGSILLPPIHYAAAPFAAAFQGTVAVAPGTVAAIILDVARSLSRQGFAALAIANAHLDPDHLAALAEVTARAEAERLLPVVAPDLTRKPWASRLTDEFKTGACHAGRFEGSVVLAVRPDLVRESVRASLPGNPASLATAIRNGARTFEEAGGPRAYFGWPAQASAAEGKETIETLGGILADAVFEALKMEPRV